MRVVPIHTEKELILRLKEGREWAFENLYRQYSARLIGKLFRLTKSEALAAELLQDVFIRVWNSRQHIDQDKSFRSYLFKITENIAIDFFRKAARDKQLHAELLEIASSGYQHTSDDFCIEENYQALETVIDGLPPQRRQIFKMIKLEGRSYAEVSSLLNISTSTISDHIVKATKAIQQQLANKPQVAVSLISFFLLR